MSVSSSQAFELAKSYIAPDPKGHTPKGEYEMVVHPEYEENDDFFAFFVNTKKYFATGDFRDGVLGIGAILVNKSTGKVREVGTYLPWEEILLREKEKGETHV